MKFIIYGDPIPLARPRFGKSRVWDSQKQLKLCTGITIKGLHGENPYFEPPIAVEFNFFFAIPKTSKKKTINPGDPFPHRPDIDNCQKFYIDVCTGILYHDDRYITQVVAFKKYDIEPRTEMVIWTIK